MITSPLNSSYFKTNFFYLKTINNQSIIRLQAPFASGAEHNVCLLEDEKISDCNFVYKYPECFWNANDASVMHSNLDLLNRLGIQTLETEILNLIADNSVQGQL